MFSKSTRCKIAFADKSTVYFPCDRIEYTDCMMMCYRGSSLVAAYDVCMLVSIELEDLNEGQ